VAAQKSETILRELFNQAEIEVNGTNPWDIHVHNGDFYQRVLNETSLGLGESYLEGWWDSESIDEFICHVLSADLDKKVKGNWKIALQVLRGRLFNLQSRAKAFEVGEKHYDLGNDLYKAMLDKRMNYTCAYWKDKNNLDDAQEAKLDLICRKIGAKPGMRILEYGCGWGSFAKYAAEKYGVEVLGVTVSKEQVALGMDLCKGLPVELRLQDYRTVEGKFDAVISIGIMEHVGYKNYRKYFEAVDRNLKPGGIAFVHTIGGNISVNACEPFSDKYIFPNGMLPSISQLGGAIENLFVMEDWQNIGPHYDPTLLAWHNNFEKAWPQLKANYSDRFYRMWRYYLLSSAGAFRSRSQQLWQIVLTRQHTPQPNCRFS
jgi:cyclopropane-fatty-acyl-phospholipid synthase